MFKIRLLRPIAAILLLLLAVAWMAGLFNRATPPGEKRLTPAPQLTTHVVEQRLVHDVEEIPGSVIAKHNTVVASRVLAQLKSLTVRSGDTIQAGQLIATLDDADLRAQLRAVKAQQQANLAQLTQARKQLARAQALQLKGLVAHNQVDEWQTQVNELTARESVLQQQYRGAEVALSYTQVKAPISGTLVARLQEPGAMLNPGSPLVSIYNPAQLQVEVSVRERLLTELTVGARHQISIPAAEATQYATISELVPVADSGARSFTVKLDMQWMQGVIPGMYAMLKLPVAPRPAVLIPKSLVQQYGQLSKVEVLHNGQVQSRFIRLGNEYGDEVEVVSGLLAGEHLVMGSPTALPVATEKSQSPQAAF
ncbi:efflux RND transporter periplasmic adaptor subunit [Pseudoalteromonas sp. R3]|uniref:efflux RND transporter periplasmic adaptor subunit n=1 Tax=Pseudoalteromonas sp. R3 TaxID=1709477 RepID=UPI0006B54FFA|nr:efflux RND transporter periplasmic adaptor subunit [Pseudoalteromonas sp. R3]AZZ99802.1 efflux RND transporter periplasmic adaptor subunit [Pseudoalteromonas sp. R3]